jgi:hypothetical protein
MGMDKTEIENYLNGEKLIKRQNDLYICIMPSPNIIYQYNIDRKKGLTEYWIICNYFNIENLVEDFSIYFGETSFQNGKYIWYNRMRLPENVILICISSIGKAVNIAYYFANSIEN